MEEVNLEKELKNYKIEKKILEEMVKKLKEKYISNGIPVPSDGDYEISNGLLGGKRDLNLKYINFNSLYSNFYIFYFILIFFFFFIFSYLHYLRFNFLN
jgi:hypothetical protein